MGQLAPQLFHGQVCVIPSLSHSQGADTRSRVHFKCAIWNLLLSTLNMRSKELSLSVKQAIIRLKNRNKPIREIAKTLGVAKSTVWNILKKKERTGELSNTKRPGRPQKITVVDDRRIISLVKKNPFTTVGQIKNTLQEVGVRMCVKVTKPQKQEDQIRVCQTLLIFSQMLQNSLDGASQCRWTMTRSILRKQPKSLRQRGGMLCNGQVNHLT